MQKQSPIKLSISVVCYRSSESELRALLSSVLDAISRLSADMDIEKVPVYLIDNSEVEQLSLAIFSDQKDLADKLGVELRLVHGQGNIGYGRAHNLVLPKLESDFHLILNPDVEIEEDALLQGVSYLIKNSETKAVSPAARNASGDKQYLCKRYPSVLTFLIRGYCPAFMRQLFAKRLAYYEMRELSEDKAGLNIPIISGCFMLCRTEALIAIGGFDENYFLYFEDFDLSLRLGNLVYLPQMKIVHGGGHAAGKGLAHLRMFARSGMRFFSTHGWRFLRQ